MTLVSMIDLLAVLRPDVDADIVCVRLRGGATYVLSIREILCEGVLWTRFERESDGTTRAMLYSDRRDVPAEAITSIRAAKFAEFVGSASVGSR